MGRVKRERWHEREIDIDILLYGNQLNYNENITVPHPRMHERRFVLLPASEIAGSAYHPKLDCSVCRLLENCKDNSVVDCLI